MSLRRLRPRSPYVAILLIAKSALLSGTPLELMRMKISETVSTSRSSARPMMPICAFWILPRWARLVSKILASTSGLRSRYSRAKDSGDSELKYSLMSAIHCGFFRITGVSVANSSVIGLKAIVIRTDLYRLLITLRPATAALSAVMRCWPSIRICW